MDALFQLIGFVIGLDKYLGHLHLLGGFILAFGLSMDYTAKQVISHLIVAGVVMTFFGLLFGHMMTGSFAMTLELSGSSGQLFGLGLGFFCGGALGIAAKLFRGLGK